MPTAISILQWATAGGFLLLGIAAVRQWIESRDAKEGYFALALGCLSVVSILGRVDALTDYRHGLINDVSLAVFVASGFFFLLFRHGFLPLARWTLVLAGLIGVAITAATIAAAIPSGRQPQLSTLQSAALMSLVLYWGVCVVEPVLRFWKASAGRPLIQRNRLKSLSISYGTIVVILIVAVAARPEEGSGLNLALQIVVVALVALMYVSLSPPQWLRRRWRQREEEDLRLSDDLLSFAPDRSVLADRALRWAVRLVGADQGVIIDADREVLAGYGLERDEAVAIARDLEAPAKPQIVPAGARGFAILVPLRADEGAGTLVVYSGPFIRLFGSDEVERLQTHAAAIAVALGRVRLTEEIAHLAEIKSAFIRNAAHELRTPLSTMLGLSTTLFESYDKLREDQLKDGLAGMVRQGNRMRSLINDLLDLSQIEQGATRPVLVDVDLKDVVDQSIEVAPPTNNVRIEVDIESGLRVLADPRRLTQVITNLLTNAYRYGGANVGVRAQRHNGRVRMYVEDDGGGVPPDILSDVFEPFVRSVSNQKTEGSGLGLTIVRGIVESFGGEVNYLPGGKGGAIFLVELDGS